MTTRRFAWAVWGLTLVQEEAFRDLVGRYAEIGMSELIFYFPEVEEHRANLEKTAAVLPELRSGA